MRPGPIGPGNIPVISNARGTEKLQCGPAQLGREMQANGPKQGFTHVLQCGPAQLGREISPCL